MEKTLFAVSEILAQEFETLDPSEAYAGLPWADAFRISMRRLAAATSVITVHEAGETLGLTATSVTSLSMDPPSLLISIKNTSSVLESLRRVKAFTVHLLAEDQAHQANAFAGRYGPGPKAIHVDWVHQEGSSPRLAGASSHIECRVSRFMPVHSHIVIVGIVEQVRNNSNDRPLIYFDGKFHAVGGQL